ncbi:MAG: response regulator transcription factor [Bacteroidetes bacterium]|nr:response regulator transcription factor [Bacteroidota bacterium]
MDKIYNIALADDHALFLDGISTLIEAQLNLNVVCKAQNGKELIDFVELSVPDLCIIDMEMPIMNGLQASELLLKKYPNMKVIILTMYQEQSLMKNLIKNGITK